MAIDTSQIQEADLEKNVDELLLTQSLNEELRQNQNEPEDDLSLTKKSWRFVDQEAWFWRIG